jgi:hypothetical protein
MKISKKAEFLVKNIVKGKVTYLEVMNCNAVREDPTLAEQIDAYIEREGLEVDKTK